MAVNAYARPIPFRTRRVRARQTALLQYSGYSTTAEGIAAIQAQIISIKTTLVSGVEEAAYGDKRVGYRSMEELREILAALEEELDDLLGIGGRVRQIRMTTSWDKAL